MVTRFVLSLDEAKELHNSLGRAIEEAVDHEMTQTVITSTPGIPVFWVNPHKTTQGILEKIE